MSTIYDILYCKRGAKYRDEVIKDYSLLRTKPDIDKPAGALAGNTRIHGDASKQVQEKIIDKLVEIGARYKLSYRDIAHLLLMCKAESGFNPDAAAGTSSAGGLGQYTKATVEEAAKSHISNKRLGFSLDLSGDFIFDAERGAYGVVLSYMISKEKSLKYFGKDYERNLYLFHHESWYLKPTEKRLASPGIIEVKKIINKKILPYLDKIEQLLARKADVSFKLITKDDQPYPNQPYVAIFPASVAVSKRPKSVQAEQDKKSQVIFGKTDENGKTQLISAAGLSEVIFVILNKDYKNLLGVNKNKSNTYIIDKNETLTKISKETGVSVAELQKINHIKDPNKIKAGQELKLHSGEYLWRRPPMDLISKYLENTLNMHTAAAPAVVEHKRSHIVLPGGNASQCHKEDTNVVAIRGGATSAQLAERKKQQDIPHKTVENEIKKKISIKPASTGKVIKEGLLFPLPLKSEQTYHTGERAFRSNRGKRLHAACDLYAPVGTEIRAMEDGVVLRCGAFYWQTDAIEVDHGTFIARYGEVSPMSISERKKLTGSTLKRGDIFAKVGQLVKPDGKKYKYSMLHLEMYDKTAEGSLSNQSAPFQRRADLIDPTATIDKCAMK